MSMRERIAMAMCGPSWNATNFNETPDGSTPEENREYYLHMADVALATLSEPTEGMVERGVEADFGKTLGERVSNSFSEMIQAAREGK